MPDQPPPGGRVADFPGELEAFLAELNRAPAEADGAAVLRRRLRALREDAADQIAALRQRIEVAEANLAAARAELAATRDELADIRCSRAWRIACRLSALQRWLPGRKGDRSG